MLQFKRLFFVFVFFCCAAAQYTCVPYPNTTANPCNDFVSYPLFALNTGANQTVDSAVATAGSSVTLVKSLLNTSSMGLALYRMMCGFFFPNCTEVTAGATSVAVASPVCSSQCNNFKATLALLPANVTTLLLSALPNPNCDAPPYQTVPVNTTVINGVTVSIACIAGPSQPTCRWPWIPTNEGACGLSCPLAIFTKSQMDAVEPIIQGLLWPGLIILVLTLAILVLRPSRLMVYSTSPPFFVTLMQLGTLIGVLSSYWPDTMPSCRDNHTLSSQDDASCAMQGTFFIFSSLSSSCWWSLVSVNIFFIAYQIQLPSARLMTALYHAYAWGLPLVVVIITLAAQKIGPGAGGSPCFFDTRYWDGWFVDGFYYTIIGVQTHLGLILLITVLWRLRHSITSSGQVRLIMWCFSYFLVGDYNLAYRCYQRYFNNDLNDGLTYFFGCTLFNTDESYNCEPSFRTSFAMFVLLVALLLIQSFLSFIFFAATTENWYLVKERLSGGFAPRTVMSTGSSRLPSKIGPNSSSQTPSSDDS